MISEHKNTTQATEYFIAHGSDDVCHCGELSPGQVVATGRPILEIFSTEPEYTARRAALGIPEPEPEGVPE